MKKLFYIVLLLLLFALVGCGGESTSNANGDSAAQSPEANNEVTVMKIGSTDKSDVAMGKAMYKFKEIVEEETNGSIIVEVYPDSQLGGERDTVEGIQLGVIQGGPIGAAVVSNFAPRMNIWSLPFLFPDRETSHRVLDGPIGQEVLDDLSEVGIIGLNYWESGIRNLTNDSKVIKTPDDISGLVIRTLESQLHLDVFNELGANPTPIAFPELFSSLQQGVVDGQENPFSVIAEAAIYEVQGYVTETEHFIGVNPFMVNKAFFEGLTETEQEAIRKAVDEAQAFQREEKAKEDEHYKNFLIEQGMTITSLTPEERQLWVDKVQPVYEKYKGEFGADLVDRLLEEVNQ
ncbi:TRAP transporter substrate-binding protein DctP [Halalkalibacterium ligniniphilum]|uniref:TRAP transporter substrate-binding protein DctP n=1 Tax=Halalkalibacterium ligniniphilum TaxID=1134413 RepID=UPI00034DB16C|nr:TRAP transporter substrate-binding protein DctP [Halalkalibacterium ligniniphilum]